jgi:phage shock protein A
MAIFERIADILKANINDMIDRAEDPEKMVKQLILEMEEQVDDATKALGQAMGSQKIAAKELAAAKAEAADWNDKAKVALRADREELAKKALDAKVGIESQIEHLEESYNSITAQVDKLKDQVQTLKMKLDEARARQNVLIARSKMADAAAGVATAISSTSTDSAFAKLDKMERKITEKEATAEAYTELNGADVDVNADASVVERGFFRRLPLDRIAGLRGKLFAGRFLRFRSQQRERAVVVPFKEGTEKRVDDALGTFRVLDVQRSALVAARVGLGRRRNVRIRRAVGRRTAATGQRKTKAERGAQ